MAFLNMEEKKNNGLAVFLFLIIGVMIIFVSLNDFVNAYASKKWPKVNGWIVKSEIRIYKDKGTSYCPEITWTYRVGGTTYDGSIDSFCSSLTRAQSKIARFPVGVRVPISYLPQDPHNSTIEPGVLRIPIYVLFFGILSIGFAFYNIL